MPILMLEKDDPQKELEFEVKCALEEDPSLRLNRWLEWNIGMLKWIQSMHPDVLNHGHENPSQIVK